MEMNKYDIYWVDYIKEESVNKRIEDLTRDDFTRRPALIIDPNTIVLVAKITKHTPRKEFAKEYKVKNWKESGLLVPSTIRFSKKDKISKDKIIRYMGHLSNEDIEAIEKDNLIEGYKLNESLVETHKELNSVLWNKDHSLKEEVREKIYDLVAEFEENLEIPLNIMDIELVGSNASYNYTDKSDVDVHIITDFSSYGYPEELVSAAMNAFKSNFNKSYDIDYKGYNVEIYVEDINSQPVSNGIYSVLRDEWIKEPSPLEPIEVDLEPELSEYRRRIDDALKDGNREDIQAIIDELYILRRNSVAAEGEFGKGNLIFKQIRNDGLLDGLKNKKADIKSRELSLEGLNKYNSLHTK